MTSKERGREKPEKEKRETIKEERYREHQIGWISRKAIPRGGVTTEDTRSLFKSTNLCCLDILNFLKPPNELSLIKYQTFVSTFVCKIKNPTCIPIYNVIMYLFHAF